MLAPDKIAHLKAGTLASGFGIVLGAGVGLVAGKVLLHLPQSALQLMVLVAAGAGSLIAAASAGITKERADAADNTIHPGMHGVETADALATAAPGMVSCALILLVARLVADGVLPWAA